MANTVHLHAVGVCRPGPEANYVEDDYRVAPSLGLALVSAGLGGIGGQGRPAAKLAIWSVLGHVELQRADEGPIERLRAGLARADEAIARLFLGGTMSPPPASFAGLLVAGRTCVAAHVGTARIYQLRGSTLVHVSEDHTLAAEFAALGRELPEPSYADVMTRALGFAESGGPTLRELAVEAGDRFVLCTKRVRDVLDDDALLELATEPELERGRARLLAALAEHGSRNRYGANTVVLAELTTDQPRCADEGASHRPVRSWLYDPGAALAEPPGQWPHPSPAWFREVYGLVMGEDK